MDRIPLLLIPGTLCSPRLWTDVLPLLEPSAEVRLADVTTQTSIAQMAREALAAMRGDFALAGFSMGGYVALEIMRTAPQRVRGLALVNTQARPESPQARENREKAVALAQRDFPKVAAGLRKFMLAARHADDARINAQVEAMMLEVGAQAFERQARAIMDRADSRPSLSAIACPTLVFGSLEDKVTPPDASEEMAAAISGAKLQLLPANGHLTPIEAPKELASALQEWLKSLPNS